MFERRELCRAWAFLCGNIAYHVAIAGTTQHQGICVYRHAPCIVGSCVFVFHRSRPQAVDVNPHDYRAWYGLGQTYEIHQMCVRGLGVVLPFCMRAPNEMCCAE